MEGKVGLCNDLRPILSVFRAASVVLDIERPKGRTGDFFSPKCTSHSLSFSTSQCAHSLERLSIVPHDHESAKPSDLCPDTWKNEICLGRRGKQRENISRAELGDFGPLRGPVSAVLTISEGLKNGRAKNPNFVNLPAWLGISVVLGYWFWG